MCHSLVTVVRIFFSLPTTMCWWIKIIVINNMFGAGCWYAVAGSRKARAQELIDATTKAIYTHMSTVLSSEHQELLALLLALQRLHTTGRLNDLEMSLWTQDCIQAAQLQSHLESVDDVRCPDWLSQKVLVDIFCDIMALGVQGRKYSTNPTTP